MAENPPEATDNAVPAVSHDPSVASRPCLSPLNIASTSNLLEAQWSDIFEGDNRVALGIFGIEWEVFSSKQLCTIYSKLNIKGVRNAKKPDMVHRISKSHTNQKAYGAILSWADSKMTPKEKERNLRKQIQCPFRLMDVVFPDQFVEDFVSLRNVSSRQLLDSGRASNEQHFWEHVALAFAEPEDTYGMLHFLDDDIMEDHWHIDHSKIVLHDWKKLCAMWKAINADNKAALNRFTQSGTHHNNFYSYCTGKVETYYLWKYLELQPNANAMVEACLPEECAISSNGL